LLARCRAERLEPPARTRVERVLGAANRLADARFCAAITGRLSATAVLGLDDLIAEPIAGELTGDGQAGEDRPAPPVVMLDEDAEDVDPPGPLSRRPRRVAGRACSPS
jgi:hypothetical protein